MHTHLCTHAYINKFVPAFNKNHTHTHTDTHVQASVNYKDTLDTIDPKVKILNNHEQHKTKSETRM